MTKKEIKSLNEELPEFFLNELEKRLETDPLNVGALMSLYDPSVQNGEYFCIGYQMCNEFNGCNHYSSCTIDV